MRRPQALPEDAHKNDFLEVLAARATQVHRWVVVVHPPIPVVMARTTRSAVRRDRTSRQGVQGWGGQGVRGIRLTGKRGSVVAAFMIALDEEILLVSSGGVIIRTAAREIASQGRDATGVRVMNLDEGQTVAAVARVTAENEEEE